MMLTGLVAFRLIQIMVGSVCIIVLVWRLARHWNEMSRGQKLFHLGLQLILFASVWDLYIILLSNRDFSFRVIPYFVGLLFLYTYILEPKRSYEKRLGNEPFENSKEDCE